MRALPKWLRHWAARFLVYRSEETMGTIRDYANGKWEVVHSWQNEGQANQGIEIIDNMLSNGRDAIYMMTLAVGPGRGAFLVLDSTRAYYERAFWEGIYGTKEAFLEVRDYCRKRADEMGFRRTDEVDTAGR